MSRLVPAAAVLLLACSACKKADSGDPASADPGDGRLAVGVPAPPLTPAEWARGAPVSAFEPGKAYVVEFWATWCGPCLAAMPHLDEVAKRYRADGLAVVAVTTTDDRANTPDAVARYLTGPGRDIDIAFAVCRAPAVDKAYMAASGTQTLPATFVVDRAGKVAYIGHPDDLDEVLPKVLAGTWQGEADARALRQQDAEFDDILVRVQQAGRLAQIQAGQGPLAAAAINRAVEKAAGEAAADLDRYAEKYPGRAARPVARLNRAQVLMQARRFADAKAQTEPVLEESAKRRNADFLGVVLSLWTNKGLNPDRKYPELPVRAADEMLKLKGDGDLSALAAAAQAYYFAGEKAKGGEYAAKALAVARDPRERMQLEKALRQYTE